MAWPHPFFIQHQTAYGKDVAAFSLAYTSRKKEALGKTGKDICIGIWQESFLSPSQQSQVITETKVLVSLSVLT